MDISGCGRQIFRRCQTGKGRSILGQFKLMAGLDPEKASAYARVIAANQPDTADRLVGHKHFWRSDISIHRRPRWYASVKMSSKRVIGAETCNSENLLGLHLGDGVTYFQQTGREYEDLFPVWDWSRLPGTTCRQNRRSLVPNSKACRGQSHFVGGLSNGVQGIAAMEYRRDGLRARKAWFFLDETVVCLGAGIECPGPEPVLTSVNQCRLHGPVTRSAVRGAPQRQWIHHGGVGYVFLEPGNVTVRAQKQKGDWYRVHHRESKDAVMRQVFSLWIDHGSSPKAARYAYAVLPGVASAELPSLCDSLPIKILHQSPSLQAISSADGKLVQAAFFEPGRLAWGSKRSIEVDKPCLVMLDRTGDRTRLHVADPTHLQERVSIRLSERPTTLDVALPQGGLAGQTVTLELH